MLKSIYMDALYSTWIETSEVGEGNAGWLS